MFDQSLGRLLLMLSLLLGCHSPGSISELPYFERGNLSPVWIAESAVSEDDYQRVKDFDLTDQTGAFVSNETVSGKPYVSNFFFATCTNLCPRLKTQLTAIPEAFSPDQVQILSHSVMPEVDTVESLAAYSAVNGIKVQQWKLLTGARKAIYTLATESYGAHLSRVGASADPKNSFLHTETVYLLDGNGYVRGLYNGTLQLDIQSLVEDIEILLREGLNVS